MTCMIKPLEPAELAEVKRRQDLAMTEYRPQADATAETLIEKIARNIATAAGRASVNTEDQVTARRGVKGGVLSGSYLMAIPNDAGDLRNIPVSEILKNPEFYHGMLIPDPMEPDYDDGRLVCKLYLLQPIPCAHSFARGGKTYILSRGVEWIECLQGKAAETALAFAKALGLHPDVCAYAGRFACVQNGKLVVLDKAGQHYLVGSRIQPYRIKTQPNGDTTRVPIDPPRPVIDMMNVPDVVGRLRPVDAVITAPTMRLDGSLLLAPGYDASTRLMLDVSGDDVLEVPECPSKEDALAALGRLWLPVKDFPFVSTADRAVLLAALFTAVVRPVLPTAPAFGLDASIQASGKTLLATVIGILAGSDEPLLVPHTHGRDDEEIRKRITSILAAAVACVIWDNVVGIHDSPSKAAALTSREYSDRLLGRSETVTFPNRTLWLITGNNLTLAGDLTRRVMVCRLDPRTERPFARSFDLDPAAYVRQHRQEMVRDVLTIQRAYRAAAPAPAPGKMASFEDWDAMVRQPIAWLATLRDDLVDPMQAVDARQVLDPAQESLALLLDSIGRICGGRVFETRQIVDAYTLARQDADSLLDEDDVEARAFRDLAETLEDFNVRAGRLSTRSIGRILANRVDRIVDGRCLRRVGQGRVATWKIETVGGEA